MFTAYCYPMRLMDLSPMQCLFRAMAENDVNGVLECIREGVNVNYVDTDGRTPLAYACDRGHLDVVKVLVQAGARVNGVDNPGRRPIMHAIWKGFDDVVEYLLRMGATPHPNLNVCEGVLRDMVEIPLLDAVLHKRVRIVKLLLLAGANPNYDESTEAWLIRNILNHTTRASRATVDVELVKTLLAAGADISRADYGKPLHIKAQERGYDKLAEVLALHPFPLQALCQHKLEMQKLQQETGIFPVILD